MAVDVETAHRPWWKRLLRRLWPRQRHPLLDATLEPTAADRAAREAYQSLQTDRDDSFTWHRYDEGCRWRHVAGALARHDERVLDLGAGNGAIELAFLRGGWRIISVDRGWNPDVVALERVTGQRLHRVVADAAMLPFAPNSFGTILCLETLEHLPDATRAGEEMHRVLKPEGVALVTTPPRVRYLFGPDPHFGIRSLVMLPPHLQRAIAARRGFSAAHHYVDRIYGSTAEIGRVLRRLRLAQVLSRSRAPRRWVWDALLFRKETEP